MRRAGPSPDFAAMFEERRRLIAGNGSGEEARLRAFEFVVNATALISARIWRRPNEPWRTPCRSEAATKLKA